MGTLYNDIFLALWSLIIDIQQIFDEQLKEEGDLARRGNGSLNMYYIQSALN